MSEIEKLLQKSWLRCYKNNVPKDLKQPLNCASKQELEKKLKKNKILVEIFHENIEDIISCFKSIDGLIALIDSNGMVLSKYYPDNLSNNNINHKIRKGVYLTEDSCGTNAVSLAMIKKEKVITSKNDYFCSLFQKWDSFAEPIFMNETVIGYLNILISTRDYIKKNSLLLDYLNSKISLDYIRKTVFTREDNTLLNKREYEVLHLTALGYTINKISEELCVSESTIKYRRKVLCEKLEASNIVHAIAISFANNMLNLIEL